MKEKKFPCGCCITFGKSGEVRGVCCCEKHESCFSEHKSLKQLSLDLLHLLTHEEVCSKEEAKA